MPNMNPVAPIACEFLAEIILQGLSLGLGKTKPAYGEEGTPALQSTRYG